MNTNETQGDKDQDIEAVASPNKADSEVVTADKKLGKPEISFDDFAKVEIKLGTIVEAIPVPDTDKLLVLQVDFGLKPSSVSEGSPDQSTSTDRGEERDIRQIVSGIAHEVTPEYLVGKQCPFITNLAPRTIRGVESNGMILAVGTDTEFGLLHPHQQLQPGATVR